jgi:hypothetical protein
LAAQAKRCKAAELESQTLLFLITYYSQKVSNNSKHTLLHYEVEAPVKALWGNNNCSF